MCDDCGYYCSGTENLHCLKYSLCFVIYSWIFFAFWKPMFSFWKKKRYLYSSNWWVEWKRGDILPTSPPTHLDIHEKMRRREKGREREGERFSIYWFTPQTPATIRASTACKPEVRLYLSPPGEWRGFTCLNHDLLPSQYTWSGSPVGSGVLDPNQRAEIRDGMWVSPQRLHHGSMLPWCLFLIFIWSCSFSIFIFIF